MRNIFLVLIVCFISTSFSAESYLCKKKAPAYSVSLSVNYNGSYCGGARPQEGVLTELARPKILESTTIKIFSTGKKKPSYKVKTDPDGKCTLKLPEGEWSYTLTKDIDRSILHLNPKCSKAINKVYGTFKVSQSNTETIELLYHFECDPCDPNSKKRQ